MSFLFPLIGLISGILLDAIFNDIRLGILIIFSGLGLYYFLSKKSLDPLKAYSYRNYHYLWILIIFLGIGYIDSGLKAPEKLSTDSLRNIWYARGVVEEIRSHATGEILLIDVRTTVDSSYNISGHTHLSLRLNTDGYSASVGDVIEFPVQINHITNNANYRNGRFAEELMKRGVYYTSFASCESILKVGERKNLRSIFSGLRDKIEIKIEKSPLSQDAKSFIIAMILGDRSFLNDETSRKFSNVGIAHILALSGTHVSVVMCILLFLFFPLKFVGLHKTRFWLAIFFLWGYILLTGCYPSTVRAGIMVTFIVLALTVQRKNNGWNALFAAVFIILIIDPLSLYNFGLQLSFLSVALIITIVPYCNFIDRHKHPLLFYFNSVIIISLITTVGSWAVLSYVFGEIPLLFLPANLLILPLLPVLISASIIYIVFLFTGISLPNFDTFINFSYDFVFNLLDFVNSFGNTKISFRVSELILFVWITLLIILAYLLVNKSSRKYIIICLSCMIITVILSPLFSPSSPDSFIIRNKYHEIEAIIYKGDKELCLSFPRKKISTVSLGDYSVLVIDSPIRNHLTEIISEINDFNNRKIIIVLGSGASVTSLEPFFSFPQIAKIVIHSSWRKSKENMLIKEAKDKNSDIIHSLRDDGPVEVFL